MKLKLIIDNVEALWDKKVRDWVTVFNKIGFDLELPPTTIENTGTDGVFDCGDRMTGNEVLDMGNRV